MRIASVLFAFAIVFGGLCVFSYTRESATWDEPQHLVRGCLGWRGDNRFDPEHPPLLRLWDTLPLRDFKCDLDVIDKVSPDNWAGMGQFQYAQITLYKMNDADRLLYRARFMNVLLGVVLGTLAVSYTHLTLPTILRV